MNEWIMLQNYHDHIDLFPTSKLTNGLNKNGITNTDITLMIYRCKFSLANLKSHRCHVNARISRSKLSIKTGAHNLCDYNVNVVKQ